LNYFTASDNHLDINIFIEFPSITSDDFSLDFNEDSQNLSIIFDYRIWNVCTNMPSLNFKLLGNNECNSTEIRELKEQSISSNETIVEFKGIFIMRIIIKN